MKTNGPIKWAGILLVLVFLLNTQLLASGGGPGQPEVPFYKSAWLITSASLAILFFIVYFLRRFTDLVFEDFDSFTTLYELQVRVRVLAILALFLFPMFEYIESVYLRLYTPGWAEIIFIMVVSVVSLLLSFRKHATLTFAEILPKVSYSLVYGVIVFKSARAGMSPVLGIEAACIILFSKLIFKRLQTLLYFVLYVALVNAAFTYYFETQHQDLYIYMFATIQACVISIAMFLSEGSSNRNIRFGNRVLENSNLFILVADKNAEFVFVSKSIEAVTGLSNTRLLGDGWWNYLKHDENTVMNMKSRLIHYINKNEAVSLENSIIDRHGNTLYVQWENSVIEQKYLLSVGRNITESKLLQMEEQRRKEKQALYNRTIQNLASAPHFKTRSINEALKEILIRTANSLMVDRLSIWTLNSDYLDCEQLYVSSTNEFKSGTKLYATDYPDYFDSISAGRIMDAPDVMAHADMAGIATAQYKNHNIKSVLSVPIFINGLVAGIVQCEQGTQTRHWDSEDIAFLRAIADFTALLKEATSRRTIEDKYERLLNDAGDIIYTTDSLGNFDFINQAVSKLLGYSVNDLKGTHFTSIVHPEHRKATTLFYLRQFKKHTDTTYYEFKTFNSSGKELWVGQNVRLITSPENSKKIIGFQAVVRNISKQKEAELALQRSENIFRQIYENTGEVFYLYNLQQKRYEYISPNCYDLLGVKPAQLGSGSDVLFEYAETENRSRIAQTRRQAGDEGFYEVEFKVNVNGKIRWIYERSCAVKNQTQRVEKRAGVFLDITSRKIKEDQLTEFAIAAQNMGDGVVITDRHGLIELCNQSFLSLMEYTLEELVGKRPIEMFSGPETETSYVRQIQENRLENGSIEILQYTRSGVPKWLMIRNTPLLDDNGRIKKYIETVVDISERKRLEHEFRYIINNAGDVIYATNEFGYISFVNEAVTKVLGYRPEDLTGKHFTEIIHQEDKKWVNLFYLKQFTQRTEDSYQEFRVVKKDGDICWIGQKVRLMEDRHTENKITGFQSVLRDISPQKVAEAKLLESENNFRQISETINEVFYLYNLTEGKYEFMSPNSMEILGVDTIYFYYINNFLNDYVVPKDREHVGRAYLEVKTGEPFDIEYRIKIDLDIRWIREKAFIIRNREGVPEKVSGTYVDITHKMMQEKRLLRVNRELSLYSEQLEINNLLKEQLIYTSTFEEIASVSLGTLKTRIKDAARATLMLLNDNSNGFNAFFLDNHSVRKSTYEFADIKAYANLMKGKRFIEYNIDEAKEKSRSDLKRREENILSYIGIPIMYSGHLTGALFLGFEKPFPLGRREIELLDNYTSALSVVINKLSLQKEVTEKTDDILASLNYAKGIQQSILPNISRHKQLFKSFMRLYLPKDVVSGDFYVVESFDDYTLIALGDCTGHGVPGAFLTLLGSNFLQRIAVENKVVSPARILEQLHNQLFTMLNKNREETIRDGMELGLCIYNNKTKKLTFAGAGLFMVYFCDNVQYIVQGSKRSIGDENHGKVEFEETELNLNGTEKFYLFSDGYRDQLGGTEKRKRFSRARFLETLSTIKNLPSFQQEFFLKLKLDEHKGKHEQTDDITVIGFELN